MIDNIAKVAANEVEFRARASAVPLLETLSKCAAELGHDSELGKVAKVLIDWVYGDNFVKPAKTGPVTFTPNREAPIGQSPLGVPVYPHSPHVVAHHQV